MASSFLRTRSGGSRHVSQSLTAQQRGYAWYLQLRTELGIRCSIPCTSASLRTLSQHPQKSRVEAPQSVHALQVPIAKKRMNNNNLSASRNLVRSDSFGEPKTRPANARYTTIIALTLAVAYSVMWPVAVWVVLKCLYDLTTLTTASSTVSTF